jgi:hypothetical protein
LERPKATRALARPLDEEDVRLLLTQLESRPPEHRLLFALLYGSGLRVSEAAISAITRRLGELAAQLRQAQSELDELQIQFKRQFGVLVARRDELSNQLRKQYSSGLSPWTALLSGDDPQQIGRDLIYLDYISRARSMAVTTIKKEIERFLQYASSHPDATL